MGGLILAFLAVGFLIAFVWKRSGFISDKIFASKKSVDEPEIDMSYSTLPEFYRVMAGVDGETFWNYIETYEKELRFWISQVSSQKFSRELMSCSTRKEFFQRLKNELSR